MYNNNGNNHHFGTIPMLPHGLQQQQFVADQFLPQLHQWPNGHHPFTAANFGQLFANSATNPLDIGHGTNGSSNSADGREQQRLAMPNAEHSNGQQQPNFGISNWHTFLAVW